MNNPPVLTVVDYDAWRRGYMPPSEHVLIDALAYRGAKVKCHHGMTDACELWIVVKHDADKPLTRAMIKTIQAAHRLMMDGVDEYLDSLATPPVPKISEATAEMLGITQSDAPARQIP